MNIRKPTDYTAMFAALDALMAAQLPQMELYREIGRLVSRRSEKGAAVAASEYLQAAYPTACLLYTSCYYYVARYIARHNS